jgi:uncharacterized membrane protein
LQRYVAGAAPALRDRRFTGHGFEHDDPLSEAHEFIRSGGCPQRACGHLIEVTRFQTEEASTMADLIAIGYPDQVTAAAAADEARRLARDLVIQPDAIATIVCDREGKFHVTTTHHPVGSGASWGMFWGLLFGLLFFVPIFGMAVGAGLGALMGKVAKTGIDKQFQDQVKAMLKPGTSALFLIVEKVTPDKAVDALRKYGGTVLKSSLSKGAERELQDALHGSAAATA